VTAKCRIFQAEITLAERDEVYVQMMFFTRINKFSGLVIISSKKNDATEEERERERDAQSYRLETRSAT
jgi:hypothetical protein